MRVRRAKGGGEPRGGKQGGDRPLETHRPRRWTALRRILVGLLELVNSLLKMDRAGVLRAWQAARLVGPAGEVWQRGEREIDLERTCAREHET